VINGSLMTSDLTAKPALERIAQLISEWTIRGKATTDTAGRAVLRGFGRHYEVIFNQGDSSKIFTLHIEEQRT
jgi:hypothetical protein